MKEVLLENEQALGIRSRTADIFQAWKHLVPTAKGRNLLTCSGYSVAISEMPPLETGVI